METETKNDRGGGRAYRSRLEPFVDFIRQQRQQRKTWQEIAAQLCHEKNCRVSFQGLHQFYRRYLKRQARPHWEEAAAIAPPAASRTNAPARKVTLVATPQPQSFRQPNLNEIQLNDLTKI